MWNWFRDSALGFLLSMLLVFAIIMGLLLGLITLGERHACGEKAAQMGVESDYGFWSGCQVKIDDRWIPLDNYRVSD